jgi:hypothetical protein
MASDINRGCHQEWQPGFYERFSPGTKIENCTSLHWLGPGMPCALADAGMGAGMLSLVQPPR